MRFSIFRRKHSKENVLGKQVESIAYSAQNTICPACGSRKTAVSPETKVIKEHGVFRELSEHSCWELSEHSCLECGCKFYILTPKRF